MKHQNVLEAINLRAHTFVKEHGLSNDRIQTVESAMLIGAKIALEEAANDAVRAQQEVTKRYNEDRRVNTTL